MAVTVNAGIIYVEFNDLTGDNIEYLYLYQNDNVSHRYVKTLNTTIQQTIGTGKHYSLSIPVSENKVKYDYQTTRPIDYFLNNIERFMSYIIILTLIIVLGVISWKRKS